MMPFAFATSTEIRFGRGEALRAVPELASWGRLMVVHGAGALARGGSVARAIEALRPALPVAISEEPELAVIEAWVARAREAGIEAVVAIGGGAVIDAGKALAALIPAPSGALRHLEVVGEGRPLEAAPLPFAAIPTTAGTGEVTRNAVIQVASARRKVSLRDARMLPRLAVVDPGLTDGCPRGVTLASGLDAITQVIEPFVSTRANPLTDALCRDAIPRGLLALRRLMEAEDPGARDEMAFVSLCGGLALANAGLGVVHGLAGPLGGLSGAAHGAICGALLVPGLAMNAARAATDRLTQVKAMIASCHPGGLDAWARAQGLRGLDALGITEEMREMAAEMAATSSSMKANPVALSREDLLALMEGAR
ncbi:iron-containing alcohol dehydrogenase [Stagnihabitans tardus]|uniref:Iron-containing alcohol dehydrogenase n=1 Tax=Stagnihabitans tardus TaxID=2699202 RepID=A0AAE4YCL3_9RHOB|nr:iron-containing alcohol dehydrogenase [Stagnihabitans tardus]NBZ87764.1 iron-containing alcohol dehydrogenase [Stagnihabitans tardus]